MTTYEITLFNKKVRDLTLLGESHNQFDDGWAEQRFVQIKADTIEEARRKTLSRYPERKGFVIVDIHNIPDFV